MDYLSFNAATIAKECVSEAIKRIERGIEACGTLTHQDSKQSPAAKEYFAKQLESQRADIENLRRFSADLGHQAWKANPTRDRVNDSHIE